MGRLAGLLALAMIFPAPGRAQSSLGGWDPNDVKKARETIAAFLEKDPGLETYVEEAFAYAVFPGIGKAAFIVGGAHGNGIVFRDGDPVGKTSVTQATVGLSLGGQKFAEVIFFQHERAFERFRENNLELAAQFSAIAVTEGTSGDVSYEGGVAVFTMPLAGAMIEVSVGGQKFTFEPQGEG